MSNVSISSNNQSGGMTANRVNSPDIDQRKIITRPRVEGFIVGVLATIVIPIVLNLASSFIYDILKHVGK